jgi:hypothetical protein
MISVTLIEDKYVKREAKSGCRCNPCICKNCAC